MFAAQKLTKFVLFRSPKFDIRFTYNQQFSMSKVDIPKMITDLITNNKVMIFSKTTCPYSDKVKKLFSSLKLKYESVELDKEDCGYEIQDALTKLTGQRTVPNVFINGKHVGGWDATHKLHQQQRLRPLYDDVA